MNTTALALCLIFVLLGCFLPTLFHCGPRALNFTAEQAELHEKYLEKKKQAKRSAAKNTDMFNRISSSRLPQDAIAAFAGGPLPHTIFSSCSKELISMFPKLDRRLLYPLHPDVTAALIQKKHNFYLQKANTAHATATAAVHASQDALVATTKALTAYGGFPGPFDEQRAREQDAAAQKAHDEEVRLANRGNSPPAPPVSIVQTSADAAAASIQAATTAHDVLVAAAAVTAAALTAAQNDFAAAICKNSCCRNCPSPCCKPTLPV